MKFEGKLTGSNLKVAIVVSRFNDFITMRLLDGAKDTLVRHEVDEDNIDVALVPGAFEIPLVAKKLAQKVNTMQLSHSVVSSAVPLHIMIMSATKFLKVFHAQTTRQMFQSSSVL